ncbi:hypothetical protein JCM19233_2229 [Vibrio astriarenae]|nr:hypothetical protein JCM19233_2229 [Vibrio sp. C7]
MTINNHFPRSADDLAIYGLLGEKGFGWQSGTFYLLHV